jgi:hypothetical protein
MNGSLLPVITTFYASILGLMAALLTIQVIIKLDVQVFHNPPNGTVILY